MSQKTFRVVVVALLCLILLWQAGPTLSRHAREVWSLMAGVVDRRPMEEPAPAASGSIGGGVWGTDEEAAIAAAAAQPYVPPPKPKTSAWAAPAYVKP